MLALADSFAACLVKRTAEEIMLAARDQLKNYSDLGGPNAVTIVKSEEQARRELAETKSKLEKLETVFNSSDDNAELAKKLQQAEDRVKVVEAQLKSGAEVSKNPKKWCARVGNTYTVGSKTRLQTCCTAKLRGFHSLGKRSRSRTLQKSGTCLTLRKRFKS